MTIYTVYIVFPFVSYWTECPIFTPQKNRIRDLNNNQRLIRMG